MMIQKIGNYSSGFYSQKYFNTYSSKPSSEITFGNNVNCCRRAIVYNESTQAVYQKLSSYLKAFIKMRGNMSIPLIYKVGNESFGIKWDTKVAGMNKLEIKDKVETVADWENPISVGQTTMSANFNDSGIMLSAEITQKEPSGYKLNACYKRDGKTGRNIVMEGLTLRPNHGADDIWTSIQKYSCYSSSIDVNIEKYLKKGTISDIFRELIKAKTSLLKEPIENN